MGYIENRNSSTFNIVEICNQDCPFCSWYPKIAIDLKKLKQSIKWLPNISLQWWEPTISPYLFDIIHFARENGTDFINLITNGLKIGEDKDFAYKIAQNIDMFHFAFMSHKAEIADELWKSENTLKLKMSGIHNLIKAWAGKKIRIVHIIQNKNINDIVHFVYFIHKVFPEIWLIEFKYIQYFWNKNNLWNIPTYDESFERINKALKLCSKYGIDFLVNGIPLCKIDKNYYTKCASFHNNNSPEQMEIYATTKVEKCGTCKVSEKCIGIRKDYIMIHGDEEFR